ncbi:NUDIX hydrolase [Micropruina sp.]|uniref:NUDIX hydrolase n=1 Tax=Micropruina sp. TaxID=2737536 RepID=UPI0039E5BFDD
MSEPFRTRSFVALDPGSRPVRRRSAVRVMVSDGSSVLLLSDTDPGAPGTRWWVTPGGGIDPGEQPAQAAVRELAEETGRAVDPADLVGPVLRRVVIHGYSDQVLVQAELFYLLPVPAPFELDTSGFTDDEKITIAAWAWHPVEQLAGLPDPVWPAGLADLLALADRPASWPVDAGVVEESTVNAGELGRRAALDCTGFPDPEA